MKKYDNYLILKKNTRKISINLDLIDPYSRLFILGGAKRKKKMKTTMKVVRNLLKVVKMENQMMSLVQRTKVRIKRAAYMI